MIAPSSVLAVTIIIAAAALAQVMLL